MSLLDQLSTIYGPDSQPSFYNFVLSNNCQDKVSLKGARAVFSFTFSILTNFACILKRKTEIYNLNKDTHREK